MRCAHDMPFGAAVTEDGVRFRLWAPSVASVELDLDGKRMAMRAQGGGWYQALAREARAGSRYRFVIDGELAIADPASRFNPDDVDGASEVVDPRAFAWPHEAWRGRAWHEAVVYELHVGAFSPEATFAGVARRLDYLADLGVTCIELMPLADFPGKRNWGYDGVLPFAPDASYGTPDDLKALVAAAHARGLMVMIDVVYNHFGPQGNYLHRIASPFFTGRHATPWGAALDFAIRDVREFFIHNALYWLEEFRADGLRLDAVHAIFDDSQPDFLAELARRVREGPGRDRHVHLVLENDRNAAARLVRDERGKPAAFTAQWNDDFHHAMHVLLTGERHGYYGDYARSPLRALGRCLAQGFAYQGERSAHRRGEPRGEPSAQLPPDAFVDFLQNHDQAGNRALGERLHMLAREEAMRSAVAVLLLAPSIPLLFMGEEFAAASPFLFFCDFDGELTAAVRDGRRAEFGHAALPDPGAADTMTKSRLDWSSVGRGAHAAWHARYRDLLALRTARIVPLIPRIVAGDARHEGDERALDVRWPLADGRTLRVVLDLDKPPPRSAGELLWQDDGAWHVRWTLEHA